MRCRSGFLRFAFVVSFFLATLFTAGCAAHTRYYDEPHGDYHTWNHNEVVYYQQWSAETHRDSHRDFRKLNKDEQNQYWDWRHNHPDH